MSVSSIIIFYFGYPCICGYNSHKYLQYQPILGIFSTDFRYWTCNLGYRHYTTSFSKFTQLYSSNESPTPLFEPILAIIARLVSSIYNSNVSRDRVESRARRSDGDASLETIERSALPSGSIARPIARSSVRSVRAARSVRERTVGSSRATPSASGGLQKFEENAHDISRGRSHGPRTGNGHERSVARGSGSQRWESSGASVADSSATSSPSGVVHQ